MNLKIHRVIIILISNEEIKDVNRYIRFEKKEKLSLAVSLLSTAKVITTKMKKSFAQYKKDKEQARDQSNVNNSLSSMQIDGGNGEVSPFEYTIVDVKKMWFVKRSNVNSDDVKREFGELLDYLGEYIERDQCMMWRNRLGYLMLKKKMSVEEVRNVIDVDYKVFEF